MNLDANPSRLFLPLVAGAALVLSACGSGEGVPLEPPLAGADIGGEFELTSSTGETVRWGDFEGQYRIVYFGYAYCPDLCPTDMQRTVQGLNQFAEQSPGLAAQIQPMFITIDPERDTLEVVGEFTDAFSEDLLGLTGTPEQVKAAADAFRVFYQKGEETENGGYLVDHTNIVYLFGKAGEPLATLPTDEGPDAVTAELGKWVS